MKFPLKLLPVLVLILLGFTACMKDAMKRKYTFYRPVYSTKAEVRQQIKNNASRPLEQPGKLYYKDGYVFLSELDKGIHIIDIRNPQQPQRIAFVDVPGCVDLAVRGNILYADMYTDLVAIDISNPNQVKLASVSEGVFPHRAYYDFRADTSMVITQWVRVDTVVRHDESGWGWGMKAESFAVMSAVGGDASRGTTNGTGGSMARFALAADRLYTVSHSDIKTFDVSRAETPAYVRTTPVGNGWGVETIFPFGQHLFIGSQSGMFIFDISQKDKPVMKSKFEHARVCDPVIADGKHAYVTLRNGTQCQGFVNQMDVLDIENINTPKLVKSYPLTNPHGLSKDGDILLLCDGRDGLRVFDARNPGALTPLAQITGLETYDVIALGGIAMVLAKDGLYLVDYSLPTQPRISGTLKRFNP